MTSRSLLTVILAAGKGTRMKSAMPKVLHGVAGRSMLAHVMALAKYVGGDKLAVVIGPEMDNVRKEVLKIAPHAQVFVQENATRHRGCGSCRASRARRARRRCDGALRRHTIDPNRDRPTTA